MAKTSYERGAHRGDRRALAAACLLLAAGLATGGAAGAEEEPLVARSVTLAHQSAAEAVALIHPHLSERGTVELRPAGNTLVIRDVQATLDVVLPLLRDFDRPAREIRLEIHVVSAGTDEEDAAPALPEELVRRLRELLRYRSYRLMARAEMAVDEGREVTHRLGDYQVEFRMGTVGSDRRIKLHGFRVLRRRGEGEARSLIHTNLNLWLDRPMVLGLARTETAERALMVVLHCSRAAAEAADGGPA